MRPPEAKRAAPDSTGSDPQEIVQRDSPNSLQATASVLYAQGRCPAPERERLLEFARATRSAGAALRKDACGDPCISGSRGHVFAVQGVLDAATSGFLLYITCLSPRQWTFAKRDLSFAEVMQDGDDEGLLFMDRLPSESEGEIIRGRLGIRKRPAMSDDRLEALRARPLGGFQRENPASDDAAGIHIARRPGGGNFDALEATP